MVNVPKMNTSPPPAGKYSKSTKLSTWRCHQAIQGKSSLEQWRVRALGVLRSLRSNNKLAAGQRRETHFLSHEEKEKWIEHYVESDTAVGTKSVEDAETAIKHDQDDMRNAEKAELTTTKPETTCQEMMNSIGDGLSDLATSDNEEDGTDEDDDEDDPAGGKPSEDDKPGRVIGTISKTVQCRMEGIRQEKTKLDELTQAGWGDAADYCFERHKKYGTTELKFPAVVQPQTAGDAASSVPTTFSEPLETLDGVLGQLQLPQVTTQSGSSHMWLRSQKLQTHERISSLTLAAMPNWSNILQSRHV